MSRVVKINLNGGVKRIVSTLICLMMVLATFPIHMLKNTVSADGAGSIDLTLSSGNGSEVSSWMGTREALADANTVKNAGDINITLSNDIVVASDVDTSGLPTMTDTTQPGIAQYLFDFTDLRFAGKTITIDGTRQDKTEGQTDYKIIINNSELFFLQLENCKVILKNITIDGGWLGMNEDGTDVTGGITRSGSFINVDGSEGNNSSELEIEDGTTIKNCKNSIGTGGAIFNGGGTLTISNTNITGCTSSSSSDDAFGGAIYNGGGTLTISNTNITGCTSSSSDDACGGAIYNSDGTVTISNTNITGCTSSSPFACGGAICNDDGGTVTISDTSITSCTAYQGGAIYNLNNLIINSGSIKDCKVNSENRSNAEGDAIYNRCNLILPPKELGFLTITLTKDCYTKTSEVQTLEESIYTGTQQCGHNTTTDLEKVMGYEGIYNDVRNGGEGTADENPNRKIAFVDSESGSTVGVAYGNKSEKITIPDSVLNRPGYEFVSLSYTKTGETGDKVETPIDVNEGKFTLNDTKYAAAQCGVITVKVTYNKLYTVQYIYDGKVVGTKSGCSAGMDLSTIINNTFSNITLDGEGTPTLGDVVKPGEGYTFSNFTYGNGQTYTGGTTKWDDLKDSAVGDVITFKVGFGAAAYDTVKYVASGCMILDKKSKRTNYSGVNLPIGGLQKVPKPKNVIFDFCHHTIHHNGPNVSFIQTEAGQNITVRNLKMDGSGCK